MASPIDSEVNSAVHAITQRNTKARTIVITPICPTTTEEGFFDRVLAAFMKDGARKEEPSPATENPTHKTKITTS